MSLIWKEKQLPCLSAISDPLSLRKHRHTLSRPAGSCPQDGGQWTPQPILSPLGDESEIRQGARDVTSLFWHCCVLVPGIGLRLVPRAFPWLLPLGVMTASDALLPRSFRMWCEAVKRAPTSKSNGRRWGYRARLPVSYALWPWRCFSALWPLTSPPVKWRWNI